MFKCEKDICDLCCEPFQIAISLFCRNINNSDADVFVIMAHKAVTLFQILLEQNHISSALIKNKVIISNQALDFDCDYLFGKKIAIIDDIIISGTSIASAINKLHNIGISEDDISIIAIATDQEYLAMKFERKDGSCALLCSTVLEDAACIELSHYISRYFSRFGIPNNVDFPVYTLSNISSERIVCAFNNLLWEKGLIFSNYQNNSNGVFSLTLFPHKYIKEKLWERLGVNLEKCVHLKIRLYIKKYPSGKNEVHLMPVCVLKKIASDKLRKISDIFKPKLAVNYMQGSKSLALFRYVQFCLAHHFYVTVKNTFLSNVESILTKESFYLLFGKTFGEVVYDSITNSNFTKSKVALAVEAINEDVSSLVDEYISNTHMTDSQCQNIYDSTYCDVNYAILSPFLWWYDSKEIKVREQLKSNPKHFLLDYKDIITMSNRLNCGFSLIDLQNILSRIFGKFESENMVSSFLDRAIDEGIIVPTTYCNEDEMFLCRVYRHGEDLPFGLADECRLLLFLQYLGENIPEICFPNKGMAHVSMEKIIVLFYQMGLKQGEIFNHFLGFGNTNVLKSYLSVHGVVKGYVDPNEIKKKSIIEHFYSEKDDCGDEYITWLTTWLKNNLFLISSNELEQQLTYSIDIENIRTFLKNNERNCISSTIESNISNIALMLSDWYNEMSKQNKKDQFKEDSTILTSCSDSFVFASALATENHYFSKYWKTQIKTAFEHSNKFEDVYKLLTTIEKKNTINIGQALNSGRQKINWFNQECAKSVVENVSSMLNPFGANIWTQLWETTKNAKFLTTVKLSNLIGQAVGYLYFFSCCYDCLTSENFWEFGLKPAKYDDYEAKYLNCVNKTSSLRQNIFSLLDHVRLIQDFNQKKSEFDNLALAVIDESDICVQHIEEEIELNSPIYTIEYSSVLIFEVIPINKNYIEKAILSFWDNLGDVDLKNQTNIIRFPNISENQNSIRYGFFYSISSQNHDSGLQRGEILLSFYKILCNNLSGRVSEIKAILLPDLPAGLRFKHNVQKNIQKNSIYFYKNVIKVFDELYECDTKQQLILALSLYVEDGFINKVEELDWDEKSTIMQAEHFDKVIIYKNRYVQLNRIEDKSISYSLVEIKCDMKHGAGFLIRTHNQILCVTCNHVLSGNKTDSFKAISAYQDTKEFQLVPIKEVITFNYENGATLNATKEVAILKPLWDGRIPLDIDGIISIDDLCSNLSDSIPCNCSCYGFPYENNSEPTLSSCLRLERISTIKGYCETQINQDTESKIENGYSGGLITSYEKPNCILGIHEGRNGEKAGRMIPCSIIFDAIEEVEKNEQEL